MKIDVTREAHEAGIACERAESIDEGVLLYDDPYKIMMDPVKVINLRDSDLTGFSFTRANGLTIKVPIPNGRLQDLGLVDALIEIAPAVEQAATVVESGERRT